MSFDGIRSGVRLLRCRAGIAVVAAIVVLPAVPVLYGQQADQGSAQAPARGDANIQSDVGYALVNSATLKGQQITAATIEGNVTLSGNVRDEVSRQVAEKLVAQVDGVRSVTNNLTVGPASQQPIEGQVAGGEDTVQSGDPNAAQPAPEQAQAQSQDPSYDPAQQNMAQAGPADQTAVPQGAQPPPQQPPYGAPNYPTAQQVPVGPVTVPAGTLLQIRTSEPLDSKQLQPGAMFQATIAQDVYVGGALAFPRGAVLLGQVTGTQTNKGQLSGSQGFALKLNSISLAGQNYNLVTDTWTGKGPGKGAYSASNTVGVAGLGAVIGAIAGGGAGAAIGAAAGGAVGATASAATNGPRMVLPPEAVLNFHLAAPVTVTPVSGQEAQRLAASVTPRQPELRQRYGYGYPGYGYPPPPPPPPGYYYGYYGYGYRYPYPVYYRPGYYYYGYRY